MKGHRVAPSGIDARDWKQVMWVISTRMDPVRDCVPIENTPILSFPET